MRRWMAFPVLVLAGLLAFACARPGARPKSDPLAGHYSGAGGGGAIDHVQALATRFDQLHPGVFIQPENVGSDAGVNLAETGGTDFGFVSRDLKSEEKSQLGSLPIGANGTAVIVNADNPITGLTTEQVRKIFSGEITDWSEVGGPPGKIRVVVREKTASTRTSFEDYFFKGKPSYTPDVAEVRDIGQMTEAIKSFKTAIGMVTLEQSTVNQAGTRLLAIDGIQATMATLTDGSYPVRRDLYLIYSSDPSKLKPAIRAFIEFARSPEGKKVLERFNAQAGGWGKA